MPKIDFYILNETSRLPFACRLIEKAYKNKHQIYIHMENETSAKELDDLLWTYRDESFLPHEVVQNKTERAAILIGFAETPAPPYDILLNLGIEPPSFYQQFNRVIEIIPNEPELQSRGRENYRFYRANGYDITTHKIQTVES